MPNCLADSKHVTMPGKKTSCAKCHICGEKIPFTYGNPKELIQHMLACNDQKTTQQFNPPCCPDKKPCVRIVVCPNKQAKCKIHVGKKEALDKCASIYDAPKNAPSKCVICVAPSIGGPSNDRRRSSIKFDESGSPNLDDVITSIKTRLGTLSKSINNEENKSHDDKQKSLSGSISKTKENRRSSLNDKNRKLSADSKSVGKRKSSCGGRRKSSVQMEPSNEDAEIKPRRISETDNVKKSTNFTTAVGCQDDCIGKPKKYMPTENRKCQTEKCNKAICSAKKKSEVEKRPLPYSACNLIKRKGTKEMYKTTLETWTAGCGSIDCPKCKKKVVPLVRKQKNKIAFTSVGASLLLTCWPFCFLIPTMYNCSVDLYCPCCKHKLGVYNSSTGKATSVCLKKH